MRERLGLSRRAHLRATDTRRNAPSARGVAAQALRGELRRYRIDVHVAAELEAGELAGARLQLEVPVERFAALQLVRADPVQPEVAVKGDW